MVLCGLRRQLEVQLERAFRKAQQSRTLWLMTVLSTEAQGRAIRSAMRRAALAAT